MASFPLDWIAQALNLNRVQGPSNEVSSAAADVPTVNNDDEHHSVLATRTFSAAGSNFPVNTPSLVLPTSPAEMGSISAHESLENETQLVILYRSTRQFRDISWDLGKKSCKLPFPGQKWVPSRRPQRYAGKLALKPPTALGPLKPSPTTCSRKTERCGDRVLENVLAVTSRLTMLTNRDSTPSVYRFRSFINADSQDEDKPVANNNGNQIVAVRSQIFCGNLSAPVSSGIADEIDPVQELLDRVKAIKGSVFYNLPMPADYYTDNVDLNRLSLFDSAQLLEHRGKILARGTSSFFSITPSVGEDEEYQSLHEIVHPVGASENNNRIARLSAEMPEPASSGGTLSIWNHFVQLATPTGTGTFCSASGTSPDFVGQRTASQDKRHLSNGLGNDVQAAQNEARFHPSANIPEPEGGTDLTQATVQLENEGRSQRSGFVLSFLPFLPWGGGADDE